MSLPTTAITPDTSPSAGSAIPKTVTCNDRCAALSREAIDAIYGTEYGIATEQDEQDFFMLFKGWSHDILRLQEEFSLTVAAGADPLVVAPYFFGRLSELMDERVTVLGPGEPLLVNGFPPIMPGPMMKKWVNEKVAGLPTLHDRLDGILAAQEQQTHCSTAARATNSDASAEHRDVQTATKNPRKKARKPRKPGWTSKAWKAGDERGESVEIEMPVRSKSN